jgi:hypothetical protein
MLRGDEFVVSEHDFVLGSDDFMLLSDEFVFGDDEFVTWEHEFVSSEHEYVLGSDEFVAGDHEFVVLEHLLLRDTIAKPRAFIARAAGGGGQSPGRRRIFLPALGGGCSNLFGGTSITSGLAPGIRSG